MSFLANYVCAFYPWCLMASPLMGGILFGLVHYIDGTKPSFNAGPDEVVVIPIVCFIGGLLVCALVPFWPLLALFPLGYFGLRFVTTNISIKVKDKNG